MVLTATELNIGDIAHPIINVDTIMTGYIDLTGTSGTVVDKHQSFVRTDSTKGFSYQVNFNPAVISASGTIINNLWLTEDDLGLVQGNTTYVDPAEIANNMATGEMNISQAQNTASQAKSMVETSSPFYDMISSYSDIVDSYMEVTRSNTEQNGIDILNGQNAKEMGTSSLIFKELIENNTNMAAVYKQNLDDIRKSQDILVGEIEASHNDEVRDARAYQEWLNQNGKALNSQSSSNALAFINQKEQEKLNKDASTLLSEWGIDVEALFTNKLKPQ